MVASVEYHGRARENSSGFDTPLQGWRLKLLPLHACFEFFLQTVSRMHY